jgi:hypothetical protein
MYTQHPEWGPASHHPENPRSVENTALAVSARIDLRDDAGQPVDDN